MKSPMRATKKPVTIDFIEWTGKNLYDVEYFISGGGLCIDSHMDNLKWGDYQDIVNDKGLIIKTLEGEHIASIGDMIIKGISGEFYPCKPDIFALTYDVNKPHRKLVQFKDY